MNSFIAGLKATLSPRGLGGAIAIVALLVLAEMAGWGPAAIAAKIRSKAA